MSSVTPAIQPELAHLAEQVRALFASWTGRPPEVIAAAPGRVNLIGEHTDYSDGFVLPMAIDRWCVAGAARATGGGWVMSDAVGRGETANFDPKSRDGAALPGWARYPVGAVWKTLDALGQRVDRLAGIQLAIDSSVPLGAGLSSSAAVELAAAACTAELAGVALSAERLAEVARAAEHDVAGVPCGVMDQTVCACAEAGRAMLLDCRTMARTSVALPEPAEAIVVISHSGVKHALGSGEYAKRRASCERAAAVLGVRALRDADLALLDRRGSGLDAVDRSCAKHVITENARVLAFADALKVADLARAGTLMFESHASLRDDFRVSCDELDAMVETARGIAGVFGSRMTGGGFGGCTVTLCTPAAFEPLARELARLPLGPHRIAPFAARAVGGVRAWRI